MVYSVEVKNGCRCFIRHGMSEREHFSNEADAQAYAENMVEEMRKTFCKKHDFNLVKLSFGYTITIVPRI
jgi:hypothetical protein